MSFKPYLIGLGIATGLCCFQACGGESAPKADTPTGAVMSNVEALKTNDLSIIVNNVLTADQKSKIEANWDEVRKEEVSDMEKQMFAAKIQEVISGKLLEDNMPMIEANMAQMDLNQISELIGMLSAGVVTSDKMDDKQKEQAGKFIAALSAWVKTSGINKPENVKKAFTALQTAVKDLGISTQEEVAALSFDQVVDKVGILYGGVKGALDVYGISIDSVLNSVKVTSTDESGDSAKVKVSFEMFGDTHEVDVDLKKINGKWINPEASEELSKTLSKM